MLDRVAAFVRAIIRIERHDGRSEPVQRQKMQVKIRSVLQQDCDAMAEAVARARVALPQVGDDLRRVAVRDLPPFRQV